MPTNRTRTKRTRSGGAAEIAQAARFYFTIQRLCCRECWPGFFQGMTEADLLRYWQDNEPALLKAGLELMQQRNRPAQRPIDYFLTLEAKHPRRKIGRTSWIGPVRPDGGDRTRYSDDFETDEQYLNRLGLLEAWERAALIQ